MARITVTITALTAEELVLMREAAVQAQRSTANWLAALVRQTLQQNRTLLHSPAQTSKQPVVNYDNDTSAVPDWLTRDNTVPRKSAPGVYVPTDAELEFLETLKKPSS